MDTIKDSRVFDIGYLSGGALQSTGYELADSSNADFASFYAKNGNSAQSALERFVKDYGA